MADVEKKVQQEVLNDYFHKLRLIGQGAHDEILHTQAVPQVKTTKLVTAIRDGLHHQSDCCTKFLKILDEMAIFDELTAEFRSSLEEARHLLTKPKRNATENLKRRQTKPSHGTLSSKENLQKGSTHIQETRTTIPSCSLWIIAISVAVIASVWGCVYLIYGTAERPMDRFSKSVQSSVIKGDPIPTVINHPEDNKPTVPNQIINKPYESGPKVVELCIQRLNSPGFGMLDDNNFMRRVAYVMSDFGRNMKGGGGIWQLPYTAFEDTMDTRAHKRLPHKYERIWDAYKIDWKSVKYKDLDKPFYSALAARLYLSNSPKHIPPAHQVNEQAKYWKFQYMQGQGDLQSFLNKVSELEEANEI